MRQRAMGPGFLVATLLAFSHPPMSAAQGPPPRPEGYETPAGILAKMRQSTSELVWVTVGLSTPAYSFTDSMHESMRIELTELDVLVHLLTDYGDQVPEWRTTSTSVTSLRLPDREEPGREVNILAPEEKLRILSAEIRRLRDRATVAWRWHAELGNEPGADAQRRVERKRLVAGLATLLNKLGVDPSTPTPAPGIIQQLEQLVETSRGAGRPAPPAATPSSPR